MEFVLVDKLESLRVDVIKVPCYKLKDIYFYLKYILLYNLMNTPVLPILCFQTKQILQIQIHQQLQFKLTKASIK